jgi:hypothetical protein
MIDDPLDELIEEDDSNEAYCMTCKQKTPMENPEPIWTRRGAPGTRGTCSVCGTTVFRMGKTRAHTLMQRPDPVQVIEAPRSKAGRKVNVNTNVVYINYSIPDVEFAEILAEDLNKIGIHTWLAESNPSNVQWATGVHPALVECKRMIVIMTPLAAKAINVTDGWKFFLEARKPIIVIQLEQGPVPDELRTKPRFDFSGDEYKRSFRELAQTLTK